MSDDDLAVPPGARLVHIGFAKTGTTSVQGALAGARSQLAEHGVVYPGTDRYQKAAGVYISGAAGRDGDPKARERDWTRLVAQTKAAGDRRVVISSEWLAETASGNVRRVVDDLGGDRVHIVATLRPLVRIMPSTWQQYLQNGQPLPYYRWLRGMLLRPPYTLPTPSFWARHDHAEILTRWVDVVGADHVTAIVVDPSDHSMVLRTFERLLAVPAGLLVPEPPERENRSLSWPEAEMLRMVNRAFHHLGWSNALWRSTVQLGLVQRLAELRPEVELPKLELPRWAAERATEIGAEIAQRITGLGISVVGDLDSLGRAPATTYHGRPPRPTVPAAIAAEAIIASIAQGMETGYVDGRSALRAANSVYSLPKATPRPHHRIPMKLRRRLIRAYRKVRG